jgi:hypothetical protein
MLSTSSSAQRQFEHPTDDNLNSPLVLVMSTKSKGRYSQRFAEGEGDGDPASIEALDDRDDATRPSEFGREASGFRSQ